MAMVFSFHFGVGRSVNRSGPILFVVVTEDLWIGEVRLMGKRSAILEREQR
jgi:hypothetical protein